MRLPIITLALCLLGANAVCDGVKIDYYVGASLKTFGDSFVAQNNFTASLAGMMKSTQTNLGVSGTGASRVALNGYANLPLNGGHYNIVAEAAANDLYRNGAAASTLSKIRDCYKAFLAAAFLNTAIPASSASSSGPTGPIGPVGIWGEKAQSLGGTARYAPTNGAFLSWTFSGNSVVVGTFASDGTVYPLGDINVYIDNVLVETVNFAGDTDGNIGAYDSEKKQGLTPAALVYTGLSAGSHTVKVEKAGGSYMLIDYFGTLVAPATAPSVFVGEVHKLNAIGYAAQPKRSPTVDAAGTAAIADSVNYFADLGYPTVLVPINDFYNLANGVSSDNEHPNSIGGVQIANAYVSKSRF